MSVKKNKETLQRTFEEVWNKGNWDVIPELISPKYDHGNWNGLSGYKELVSQYRNAFPDLKTEIEQVIGEGDWPASRFSIKGTFRGKFANIEPTGKEVKWIQVAFTQYKDGKVLTNVPIVDSQNVYQ